MIAMLVCPLYVGNLGCSKMIAILVGFFLFWKPWLLQNESYVSGLPSMLEPWTAVK